MPILESARREAFAQALAQGLPPMQAGDAAGYRSRGNRTRQRATDPEILRRVSEITLERDGPASQDLRPLIKDLLEAAGQARALDSAAGYAAMRGLIAEAVRLKRLLPQPPVFTAPVSHVSAAAQAPPVFQRPVPVLDAEAWEARYAPWLPPPT